MIVRMLALAAVLGATTGCETWNRMIGRAKAPPLEGERIAVLTNNRTLTADQELAGARVLLPAPTPNASWPQAGGYANHAMHHIQIKDSLTRAWSASIGAGADDEERLNASPIVAHGMVFTLDAESRVSAFAAATGDRIWSVELAPKDEDDGHIGGGVAYEDGAVFVTTGFAQIIALDAKTGKQLWREQADAPMRAAPTVRGGRVFVVTLNNQLFALNAKNGETLWRHRGVPEIASVLGGASPAVDRGTVVVAYTSGELTALTVENGRVLWQDALITQRRTDVVSSLSGIRGRPVIDRDRVIAVSNAGLMVAIDLRTGRRLWDRQVVGIESPWVAGNYIFMLTTDSEIAALSRTDGRIQWVRGLPRFEDPEDQKDPIIWTGPILASDRLIVAGSNGEALAISPYSGRILGVVEMPDAVTVAPVVADGSVYFLADNAELVAYR
ncbi:MAG: PQQ-binding-like beta-propeller repeat protein [Rhodospirillaceae bacterium]